VSLTELEKLADRDERELPPVWLSLLPIVLPVALIAGQTGVDTWLGALEPAHRPAWVACAKPLVDTLGDKNIALILGAAIALGTLAWQKRATRRELAAAVETALAGGGVIILITSAGGAFGFEFKYGSFPYHFSRSHRVGNTRQLHDQTLITASAAKGGSFLKLYNRFGHAKKVHPPLHHITQRIQRVASFGSSNPGNIGFIDQTSTARKVKA